MILYYRPNVLETSTTDSQKRTTGMSPNTNPNPYQPKPAESTSRRLFLNTEQGLKSRKEDTVTMPAVP